MDINKKPLVVAVVGPTGSGKTRLAIDICKRLNGEVVSADSMQIYRKISIATAKPTKEEQEEVPHHLIDILEPWESFSVAEYVERANECIADIQARGKLPVLVGGTGLYVKALAENLVFSEESTDEEYRVQLQRMADEHGVETVYDLLKEVDSECAQNIHCNNLVKVIRSLEAYKLTGKTAKEREVMSRSEEPKFDTIMFGITFSDRKKLYDRIDMRVDMMMEQGLLQEIESLKDIEFSKTATQAIGYKELMPYLAGECPLEDCVELIKKRSRNYAKRQFTWFRNQADVQWLVADDYMSSDEMAQDAVERILQGV